MRRLGVDFGDSQTVIAETTGSGEQLRVSVVFVAPNVVNLTEDGTRRARQDVLPEAGGESTTIARHLRHFILNNSPIQVSCGSRTASYPELGREYLVSLIRKAVTSGEPDVKELVFSVPPGSPPSFFVWLGSVATGAGIPTYSVMDEIFAAAAGYGISLKNDLVLMVIDIGAEKTTATIARLRPLEHLPRSHIIARTISDFSGNTVDRWIAGDILKRCTVDPGLSNLGELSPALVAACRRVRKDLTCMNINEINVTDKLTGKHHALPFSRDDLEKTLRENNAFTELDRVITQAIVLAESRGNARDTIQHILLTGVDSQIPSMQAAIVLKFGQERVRCDLPEAAVALGAALHPAIDGDSRTLDRDYALRYWVPETSRHEYRYIARSGTGYPTREETARILISAAYDGQTHLGLAIYAFGNESQGRDPQTIELITDHKGRTCCIDRKGNADALRATWINESAPTILIATPPGRKGDVRFELAFRIDSLGILRLDARDVMTGEMILENHACAALT